MGAVFNRVTLSATGDTLLASAGQNAGDAGWQLTFAGSSWTGSVVLKQNTAPPGATVSLSTVSYFNATTGALVSAGTAITSGGSFIVSNTGLDLYAVYTHTAGTVQITLGSAGGQFGGVAVAAADVTAGTFGAFTGETGTYAFPGAVTIAGATTFTGGVTGPVLFTTLLSSVTALATPSALAATAFNAFTSTVSGAVLMGYGTTNDVALKNRAGTTVLGVGPNTTKVDVPGTLEVTGAVTALTSFSVTKSQNTSTDISVLNSTAGTSARGTVSVAADSGTLGLMSAYSSAYTADGLRVAESVNVLSNSASAGLRVFTLDATSLILGTNNVANLTFLSGGAATFSSSVVSSSPTGGLGYGTGAGGAQTQLTNKQTTVVSNTITTAITMNNEILNAATTTAFTFTNSAIAATDTVICTHESAGTSGAYSVNAFPAAGSAVISVRNNTAGNLTEAIVLRVTVIKSVSA